MSMPRKVFLIILGLSIVMGLGIGLVNVVAPDAASVNLNGENIEGWSGIPIALLSSAIPGVIFGLIGAGITALFTRKKS